MFVDLKEFHKGLAAQIRTGRKEFALELLFLPLTASAEIEKNGI